jgi:amidase
MTTTTEAPAQDSAIGIAEAVRTGRISAEQAVAAALDRIAARDADIGAFQTVRRDAALAEARAVDARADKADLPLAGVPVAIKDNIEVNGEVMVEGSTAMSSTPAAIDHPVVARLRAAGGVVVGQTRTPELCLWTATDGADRISRNPWARDVTCGGSSGGSGAAVAAGMVPIAHANDGLGSIRYPAAACGLVGIKPGKGVVPALLGRNDWNGMAVNGPLATTVADAALTLAVMADDLSLAEVVAPQRVLRIAASVKPPLLGLRSSEPMVRATFGVAALLRDAGHVIERQDPSYPLPVEIATTLRWLASAADDAETVADYSALQPRTRGQATLGRLSREVPVQPVIDNFIARSEQFFEQYDVLVTPVFAAGPLPAVEWSQRSWLSNFVANLNATGGFPAPWNVAGFPAVSVPFGSDPRTGAPTGVQLVAAPGGERMLIGVAAQLEALAPWLRTAPGYAV